MKKRSKGNKLRLMIGIVITLILTAIALTNQFIAWTNQLVDWLIKLNIEVANPNVVFLATTLFVVVGAGWVLYEIVN